jgi:hypothetical protein
MLNCIFTSFTKVYMFKQIMSGVALCAAAAAAQAAGPLDGIYQWTNGLVFYSVHQSGDSIIVGRFRSEAASNLVNQTPGLIAIRPARFDTYNLYSGTLSAAQATTVGGLPATVRTAAITGDGAFGACSVVLVMSFTTVTGGATTGQIQVNNSTVNSYGATVYSPDPANAAAYGPTNCTVSLGKELGLLTGSVTSEQLVKLR